tara:strand:+ start:851 stop:1195 length:345 start_codon:yes stop_codon:yes gene_type:complete
MARGTLVALLGFILLVSCICEIRSKQAESVEDDMLQEWEKSVKEFYTNREDDQRLKSELQEIEALFDSQDNVDLLTRYEKVVWVQIHGTGIIMIPLKNSSMRIHFLYVNIRRAS